MEHVRNPLSVILLTCMGFILGMGAVVNADGNGVTAREIYQMHKDGLSERVLLEHLQVKGFSGLLTRERVQALRKANVPRSVVQLMRTLQNQRNNQPNRKRERGSSDGRSEAGQTSGRAKPSKTRKGSMTLSSRTSRPVWFRIERSSRTLHFSTEDTRRFVGLSEGNRIQLPVPSGTWHVSLNISDRARQVTIPPGSEVRVVVVRREKERILLRWHASGATENGKRIVLKADRGTISKRIRNRSPRTTGRSDWRETRLGSHSFNYGTSSIYSRSGYGRRRYGLFSSNLQYLRMRPARWQYHGFNGLDGIRTRRHHGYHDRRGGLFDFHINLNHDFGEGRLRGSFHLKSGRRSLHIHSSHSD